MRKIFLVVPGNRLPYKRQGPSLMQMRTILNNAIGNAGIPHQTDAASKVGDPKATANRLVLLDVRPQQIQDCVPSR